MEELNPEVIRVVGARQAEREAASRADRVFQRFLDHGPAVGEIERHVGEDETEAAGGAVLIGAISNDEFRLAKDRARILLRLEPGIGSKLIRGIPEPFFEGASDPILFR